MIQTLYIAIDAAIKAGVEIMKIYNDPTSDFGIEKKADNSPLTIADKNANEVICSILQETKIPILSEEGKAIDFSTRNQWEKLWIVDPLDGTKEFIKRNGEFTV
ncbi:MAG: 3'(2'),5'-bisphosphate nucleotidase CysQ family protein, partial [Tannerellaceae bacterium]